MTIGQLVECLTGKVSSLAGSEGDGTAFNTAITVDSVAKVLHSMGYQVGACSSSSSSSISHTYIHTHCTR